MEADLLKREGREEGFDDWAERQRRVENTQARGAAEARAEEYRDLEDRYNQIEAEIRGRSPHYAALAQPEPLSLIAVQKDVPMLTRCCWSTPWANSGAICGQFRTEIRLVTCWPRARRSNGRPSVSTSS